MRDQGRSNAHERIIPHDQVNPPSRHRHGGGHGGGSTLRRTINRKLRSKKLDNPINPVIKYILFFFNVIVLLATIGMTVIGGIVLEQKEKKVDSVLTFVMDPAILLTFAGSIGVVVSIIGCAGSLRENPCLITLYRVIVTFLLVLEILLIVIIFLFYFVPDARTALRLYPEDALKDAIVEYRNDPDMEDFINTIQKMFECCGVSNDDKGYMVWSNNMYFNCTDANPSREKCGVPYSCCVLKEGEPINLLCGADALSPSPSPAIAGRINTQGCLKGLEVFLYNNALAIGGGVIGFLIPQIFLVCIACALSDQINEVRDSWKYQRQ